MTGPQISQPTPRLVLQLLLRVNETSAPYNEHVTDSSSAIQMIACSFFAPEQTPELPRATLRHGGGSLLGFVRAARLAAQCHSPDVVHAHSPHVAALWLLASVGRTRGPRPATVLTVHTSFPNISTRNRLLLLISFALFKRVVFCSRASRDSFPRPLLWLLGRRATVVSNGVALERLHHVRLRSRSCRRTSFFIVVAIGRLIPIKNPAALIDAVARAQNPVVRLVFLGDGNLRRELEERAAAYGLQGQVEFRGIVPRDEVYRILAVEADLYASMSYVEGLPVAAMEALASGVPAVLSDIAPHREITDGLPHAVRLVSTDDIDGLTEAFQTFAALDPERRKHLGWRARQHIERRFSLTRMRSGYTAVYEEALRTARRHRDKPTSTSLSRTPTRSQRYFP